MSFKFASAISDALETGDAAAECLATLEKGLAGAKPDVLFVFASPHHRDDYAGLLARLANGFSGARLLGCSGGGVIGAGRELEDTPGLAVVAGRLPKVEVMARHLTDADLPGPDDAPGAWEEALGVKASQRPQFVLLVSPFMGRADELLAGLDYAFPLSPKVGGMVSGLRDLRERVLFLDGERHNDGAVLLAFSGPVKLDTLVAQGCRGVGPIHTVTDCDGNLLKELDGEPALKALTKVFEASPPRDRELIHRALFVGLVMDPLKGSPPGPGDFLIRNVLGMDPKSKHLAVGAMLRTGQAMQFHVRDADAAAEDLRKVLDRYGAEHPSSRPDGALLFSCLGRGERMYGAPDHDSQAFLERFGRTPLAGFFCNGEIGPVGATTYLHGFTSSFGLFVPDKS